MESLVLGEFYSQQKGVNLAQQSAKMQMLSLVPLE